MAKTRRNRSVRRRKQQKGGGYSEVLDAKSMINPGNQVHQAYPGPLKDCAGTPTRPGTLTDIGPLRIPGGLPGVSSMAGVNTPPVVAGPAGLVSNWFGPSWIGKGGARKGRKGRKQQGAGTQLGSGAPANANAANVAMPPMTNMNAVKSTIVVQNANVAAVNAANANAAANAAANNAANANAAANAAANNAANANVAAANANAAATSTVPAAKQSGGRYGFFPGDGPLNPVNGVGATGVAPFARIPCEHGTFNALNPDSPPAGIQTMTTLPFSPGHTPPGLTPMRGGMSRRKRQQRQQRGGFADRVAPATVSVGAVDAMRYYAPTAGYENLPLRPMVPNNPGILMQVGYPAGHFNQACLKAGGGRKTRRRQTRQRKH